MITALRSVLKNSAIYKAFLWVFLAVLIVGGISFDLSDKKPWVIKVYNEKITDAEYKNTIVNLERHYEYFKSQGMNWPRTESIEKEALRNMISSSLLYNISKQMRISIPSILLQEQLASQLSQLPAYFFDASGQLNVEMLEKLIAPRSFESFLQETEREISSNLLFSLVSLGSYTPEFKLQAEYQKEYADKKYSIVTFSLDKALSHVKEKNVSDETLERFYKKSEHGDLYKNVEKRSGCYWKFNCKDYDIKVSKDAVKEYYDAHKQSDFLKTPAQVSVHRIFFQQSADETVDARAQAQLLHEKLRENPTTFAQTAKKIVAAKVPSQGAEKTELFSKDTDKYDKILVETAFEKLAQDGDVSEVIKTDKGYEVIQRLQRKPAEYKSLEEVYSTIESKLLEEKFVKRFKQDADRIVNNAQYNKKGLEDFIAKRKGHKESISEQPKKPGVINNQLFQTEQGKYAVFMDGNEGVILECTQIDKKVLKPFSEIKDKVSSDYYKKQAQQRLSEIAQQAVTDAKTMTIDEIAKKYDGHVQKGEYTYKNGQIDQSAVLRRPEIAKSIKSLHFAGAVIDVTGSEESYIIKLDEITPINQELFKEKSESLKSTLENKAKYQDKDSFIASLYRHGKLNNRIEIKDQLIKNTKDAVL